MIALNGRPFEGKYFGLSDFAFLLRLGALTEGLGSG